MVEKKFPHTDLFIYDSSIKHFQTKFSVACKKIQLIKNQDLFPYRVNELDFFHISL